MSHTFTAAAVFAAIRKGQTVAPVSNEEEAALIRAAQAGDEQAVYTLITLYAPAARNALARAGETLDREDAEMEVMVAFMEVIKSHDPERNPKIAGRVAERFGKALGEASSQTQTFSIPTRTMERYISILKRAEGDVEEAARIAPSHDMATETFIRITEMTRMDSISALHDDEGEADRGVDSATVVGIDVPQDPYAAIDDRILVDSLLALLDERETAITRYAYGFDALPLSEDDDPKEGLAKSREEGIAVANDTVIARVMGLSRPTVQRTRAAALNTMRAALVEPAA